MVDGLLSEIFKEETRIDGVVLFCSFCIAFITWAAPATFQIPLWAVSIIVIASTLIIAKLWIYSSASADKLRKMNRLLHDQANNTIPKTVDIRQCDDGSTLIISTKSDFFRHGLSVSIFYITDDIEELVATGYIHHIQPNNIMQTKVRELVPGLEDKLYSVIENKSNRIANIRIIPGVLAV